MRVNYNWFVSKYHDAILKLYGILFGEVYSDSEGWSPESPYVDFSRSVLEVMRDSRGDEYLEYDGWGDRKAVINCDTMEVEDNPEVIDGMGLVCVSFCDT